MGGAPVRIGIGVSSPDMSVDERLACVDISSSDSDPGPGEVTARGGGGGTARDSTGGGREALLGRGGGALRSCAPGGGARESNVRVSDSSILGERDQRYKKNKATSCYSLRADTQILPVLKGIALVMMSRSLTCTITS